MTDDKLRLLNAHIAKAIEQLAERVGVGVGERDVLNALVTNAAVRVKKAEGAQAAYRWLIATAAAVLRTAPADTPSVRH